MRNFLITYAAAGVIGSLFVFFLDSEAFFSLLSYTPVFLAVLAYGALGLRWALAKIRRSKDRAKGFVVIALALSFGIFGFSLPHLRTGPRKGFHIDATALQPGMHASAIKARMSAYQLFDREAEGYIAFGFRHNVQTEDRVIVDLSSDGTALKIEVVTN